MLMAIYQIHTYETSQGDEWLCSVTPNDGYADGETKNSSSVILINTAPPTPDLRSPTKGNQTIQNLYPQFLWNESIDPDQDTVTYFINITSLSCPDLGIFSTQDTNYTPDDYLITDCTYFWQVLASDNILNSSWSEKWNFTVQPAIILNLTTVSVDFGLLTLNQTADTDNDKPPLIVQNDGNIVANITWVSINQSIWTSQPDNTEYFQFKIDNDTTEPGSFDWGASTTTWTNLTTIDKQNRTAIAYLNYNDTNDEAEIDIRVRVPPNEPGGLRTITVYVIGQEA